MTTWKTITAISILSAIIGFILCLWLVKGESDVLLTKYLDREVLKIRYDTVYKELPQKKIYIKADARLVYDTIYVPSDLELPKDIITKPFTAKLDTIVNKDTLNLSYKFPENYFLINWQKAPIKVPVMTEYLYIEQELKWYEESWFQYGIGFLSGIGISYLFMEKK